MLRWTRVGGHRPTPVFPIRSPSQLDANRLNRTEKCPTAARRDRLSLQRRNPVSFYEIAAFPISWVAKRHVSPLGLVATALLNPTPGTIVYQLRAPSGAPGRNHPPSRSTVKRGGIHPTIARVRNGRQQAGWLSSSLGEFSANNAVHLTNLQLM